MYTSTRNALLLEDPEGVAPGWIFGRGDCGYTGGKSIAEIMEGYATSEESTESSSKKSSTPKSKMRGKFKRLRQKATGDKTTSEEGSESVPATSDAPSKSAKTPIKKKKKKDRRVTSSDDDKV